MNAHQLRVADYLALVGYLAAIIIVSRMSYRKQQTAEQYHLAGKSLGLFPVLLSTVVTFFSGVSFLGIPAWSYRNDLSFYLRTFGLLLMAPVLVYAMIPFYHRLKVQTSYEYLERRFDRNTRRLASGLFLLSRGLYLGIVVYATSLAVAVVSGLSLPVTILVIGLFCTGYTMIGGMKSVVWTQAMQFLVLVGGILVIFFSLLARLDGPLPQLWATASEAGKLRMFHFTLDPAKDVAFAALIIGALFQNLSMYGADQVSIQHYLTAKSMTQIRRAIWLQAVLMIPVNVFLYLTGTLLWLYYRQHPERLENLPTVDYIVAFFAVRELPPGVPGLIFSGLLAATMAVTAGGLSGLSTATMNDFYRLVRPGRDERHYVWMSRICTLGWGLIATILAFFVHRLGPLVEASARINSFFAGVLLGIFFLGMFSRRVRSRTTLLAAAIGLAVVIYAGLFTTITFFWYAPIGCGITILAGYLMSRAIAPADPASIEGLVYNKL